MRLLLVTALLIAGCSDDGGDVGANPDDATVVAVDRFGAAGSLFARADDPSLPGPGEAVDFDTMTTLGFGPEGELVEYYNLDVQGRVPQIGYQLIRPGGAAVEAQLPIIDAVPGDDAYTDFWRLDRVTVPDDYVANSVTSAAEVVAAGWPIEPADALVNWPVVPAGLTASVRIDGGETGTFRAWYRGQVAHYLRFDEASLAPVPLGLFEGQVPLSYIFIAFNINPGEAGGGPPSGFMTEPGSERTHNVVASLPGDDGYSPLWMVNVYDNVEFDQITDLDSAWSSTLVQTPPGEVNCPLRVIE